MVVDILNIVSLWPYGRGPLGYSLRDGMVVGSSSIYAFNFTKFYQILSRKALVVPEYFYFQDLVLHTL